MKHKLAFRGGSYSVTLTMIVAAILIVCNLFVSMLPTSMTKYDMSANKLYSITSNTKVVVNHLEQDVTIYWVVQSGQEDAVIENLLGKYESLSEHITVVKKNPDVYPTFTKQYTSEDVPNNSLIVESGERSRYISYDDIYLMEVDMYSYYYTTSFDGEGAITSAIDYVVTEDLPKVYTLQGHGEGELPTTFADSLEKENIEVESLSLLTIDEIPEDADAICIYDPQSDLSKEEAELVISYTENGGKLFVSAGAVQSGMLENLNAVLENYGVEVTEGIVIEGDREHYYFGYPTALIPDMESSELTDPLIQEQYQVILELSQGLQIGYTNKATVTALLTTSEQSYSKVAGYGLSTYDKEEGDIDGPFSIAVSVETNGGGQIIWFSAADFLNDMYNAYSSGANVDLAMNAVSSLVGEREAIAIRSKSLNYNYLTISSQTASTIKTLLIGVFPILYLGVGIVIIMRKRGRQHEKV